MKKPEDWYSQWLDGDFGDMLSFVKDIQLEAYNQAIDDAAKNAKTKEVGFHDGGFESYEFIVDPVSILKLKIK